MTDQVAEKAKKIAENVEALASESVGQVTQSLSMLDTYYQLGAIGVVLVLALMISSAIRSRITALKEPSMGVKKFSGTWFKRRSGRLIAPLLTLLLLEAASHFLSPFAADLTLLVAAEKVTLAWLLWVFLKAFVTNFLVRLSTTSLLVPAALLQLFGYYDNAVAFLSEYGFALGDVNVTAYTFLKSLLLISIAMWVGKLIGQTAEARIRSSAALTRPTQELVVKIFDIVLYAALFMVTLNVVGIDLTALAVFSGAVGVGLGFGLQKIASNFISGLILLMEKSININNLIEMDDGIYGYVRKLGARASIVETLEGKEVMVPNEDFITSRVANLTHSSKYFRIDVAVGVSYDTDMHKARDVMLEALKQCEMVSKHADHTPKVLMREFGDSSVNFMAMFWMDDVDEGRWVAQDEAMFAIWDALKENGIEIPFPQRDLHIRSGLHIEEDKKAISTKTSQEKKAKKPAKKKLEKTPKASAKRPSE